MLKINEDESKLVKKVFELYNRGYKEDEIAIILNKKNIAYGLIYRIGKINIKIDDYEINIVIDEKNEFEDILKNNKKDKFNEIIKRLDSLLENKKIIKNKEHFEDDINFLIKEIKLLEKEKPEGLEFKIQTSKRGKNIPLGYESEESKRVPILEEYFEILKEEKKYVDKYYPILENDFDVKKQFRIAIREMLAGARIDSYEELELLTSRYNRKRFELLRIEDYYIDELYELLHQYYKLDLETEEEKIDEILDFDNLKKLLKDKNVPEQIKDCIKIRIKCNKVCKEMYEYLMTNDEVEYENTKTNIALYLRDSVGNEESLKKQEKELMDFANKELRNTKVLIYKDICGTDGDRKGLNSLIDSIEKEQIKYVLVVHSNRLYRIYPEDVENGMRKLGEIVDKIEEKGAKVISTREMT